MRATSRQDGGSHCSQLISGIEEPHRDRGKKNKRSSDTRSSRQLSVLTAVLELTIICSSVACPGVGGGIDGAANIFLANLYLVPENCVIM